MAGGFIMSAVLSALADSYLVLRRSAGYRLDEAEQLIRSFIGWLDEHRGGDGFSALDVIEWACLPNGRPLWHAKRLWAVRDWAVYARAHGANVPVIPKGCLPADRKRPTPYIFQQDEIDAVMDVFAQQARLGRDRRSRWKDTTYKMLTGLLACTGIRIGEAINLDRADVDTSTGWITITTGKTGRQRLVLLHPSALDELIGYLFDPARPVAVDPEPVFVAWHGQRVNYSVFQRGFHSAVMEAGLQPQGQAKPTIHSLRHTFAVQQLTDAYRTGVDPARRLTLLSTWLGHVSPACTYWYLSATPQLLSAAADLLENPVTS